jgi:hypothetical protein
MADLIDFKKIIEKSKAKQEEGNLYDLNYRKSALEMDENELKTLVDDIDEIITCLVDEVESVKRKLEEVESLNSAYVDIMRKLVEVIVMSNKKEESSLLSEIRSWVEVERGKSR